MSAERPPDPVAASRRVPRRRESGTADARPLRRRPSTIQDVAAAAEVSQATVSRALRGLPRVNEETRQRVLRVASELDYVASPTATSLASGKTTIVAVVAPSITRWYFANLLSGVGAVLQDRGYHLLLFETGLPGEERRLVVDAQLLRRRVEGVVVMSMELDETEWDLLSSLRVPLVTVGVRAPGWDSVRIDDTEAARTATRHLVGLGHQRIAHVGGHAPREGLALMPPDRRAGYEKAMADSGLLVRPDWVEASDWTVRGGLAAGHRLLALEERPTAVFAACDELAIGVMLAARAIGLSVPEDLSVIGIDDHELAFTHDLTTVAQPVIEQGRHAGRLLVEALTSSADRRSARNVVERTKLVVRGTTAPISS